MTTFWVLKLGVGLESMACCMVTCRAAMLQLKSSRKARSKGIALACFRESESMLWAEDVDS